MSGDRKMYSFNYVIHKELPKLAWGMVITKDVTTIDVHVGETVERQDNFFVAGVWDGCFLDAEFDSAEFFCGTGAKLLDTSDEKVKISSPSHERERICVIKNEERIFISNSIPLILALSGEKFDLKYDQYEKDLCSILDGLKEYKQEIPLAGNKKMYQLFCTDVYVDNKLRIEMKLKQKHRAFSDFEDYYTSLVKVCEKIKENAEDYSRKKKYGFVTTVSAGYDSSACAAIAHDLGCETAVTFCGGKYDEDSGVEVAKQLGYFNIIERGNKEYKSKKDCIDAQFLVNGDLGSYLQFSAFEDIFAGNIVFIGVSGDYTYGVDSVANEDVKRYGVPFFQANMSYGENALTEGYIVLPMPLYAMTAHPSIQAITNSEEMEPWTLHNSYDRPIPRRIVESHGVNRTVFGQEKYGGGFSFARNFTKKQIKAKMTDIGYSDFIIWIGEKGNNSWSLKRILNALRYHVCTMPEYMAYIKAKLYIKQKHDHSDKINPYPNPGLPSRLILWGIEKVSQKYIDAINSN